MSHQIELVPDLKQLIDDFVSVRQRFRGLAEGYIVLQIERQKLQSELSNVTKQLSDMRQEQSEDKRIIESYDQLKIDYDLMVSESEKHRDEIFTENQKRVHDLEEELKEARAKSSQQAELHHKSVSQIVADYEAKLRDADEKIRELKRCSNNIPKSNVYEIPDKITPYSPLKRITPTPRGVNKKWPKLAVEITPTISANRGRGKRRAGQTKRKLFMSNDDALVDLE